MNLRRLTVTLVVLGAVLALGAAELLAQKYGGTLRVIHRGNPPSLSIHEEATVSTVMPMMPVYSNLVFFDPLQKKESEETLIPELATSWVWSNGNKDLTFRLRRGVKWHDGKPFTSKDVKHTFDVVRGVSEQRMKLNPRKVWYDNLQDVVTNGDYEVTFKLGRPQPAIVSMLASGYTPVYPAHVHPRELRTKAVGTGPFTLTGFQRDKNMTYKKFDDYFVKGRPYLDGIFIVIIRSRGTRHSALQANQADVSFPYDINAAAKRQLEEAVPSLVFDLSSSSVSENFIMNTKKPPFNDARLRKVVALAMDRDALIKSVHQGLGIKGGANLPLPYGVWGLSADKLAQVPGMGPSEVEKEKARQIMRDLGYGPNNPLKLKLSTRAIAIYVDSAVWAIEQLKQVYIDAELDQVETGNWHAKVARRDYQIGFNLTGVGVDDPDPNFFENYTCGSQRNYSDYCNPEIEKKFVAQSSETDFKKRLALVHEIDLQLQEEGARPILVHRVTYTAFWPYVKNFMNHQSTYNNYRFQEVWLDK